MTALALIIAARWNNARPSWAETALPIAVLATLCALSFAAMLRDPVAFAELFSTM